MAKSRKRGSVLATSKAFRHGGGQRGWRVTLYGPTPEYELFRISFKEPDEAGTWDWTSRTDKTETEAREKFAQIVEALEAHTAVPVRQREQRDQTIEALFELYIADSKERGKAARTVEGRESKGRAHVIPTIGDLPVTQWRLEHTRAVFDKARDSIHWAAGLNRLAHSSRTARWQLGRGGRPVRPSWSCGTSRSLHNWARATNLVRSRTRGALADMPRRRGTQSAWN